MLYWIYYGTEATFEIRRDEKSAQDCANELVKLGVRPETVHIEVCEGKQFVERITFLRQEPALTDKPTHQPPTTTGANTMVFPQLVVVTEGDHAGKSGVLQNQAGSICTVQLLTPPGDSSSLDTRTPRNASTWVRLQQSSVRPWTIWDSDVFVATLLWQLLVESYLAQYAPWYRPTRS